VGATAREAGRGTTIVARRTSCYASLETTVSQTRVPKALLRPAGQPPVELIERRTYLIRGQKVMLDSDLAGLYEVETSNLNKAVKRNAGRFPLDFMFTWAKTDSRRKNATRGTKNGDLAYTESELKSKMDIPDYVKRLLRLGLKVTVEHVPEAA